MTNDNESLTMSRQWRFVLLLSLIVLFTYYSLFIAKRHQNVDRTAHDTPVTPPSSLPISNLPVQSKPTDPIKILFAFIAIGNVPERLKVIKDNLQVLGTTANQGKYHVDCILFSYASYPKEPEWVHQMERNATSRCKIIRIFKTAYIPFLKTLIPSFLKQANYKYITISLDDVALTPPHGTFDLNKFFDTMEKHSLHVASPAIENTPHIALRPVNPEPRQVGRIARMLEFQSLSFKIEAWECMYELIDTEYPGGWGIDLWFYDYCIGNERIAGGKMALIDTMKITHNPQGLASTNNNDKDPAALMNAQMAAWEKERGIKLTIKGPEIVSTLYETD